MEATGIKFVKTYSNRDLAGPYQETEIDRQKKISNRLISIIGKYYTIMTPNGEQINIIGKRAFKTWATKNDYVTDF